MIIRRTRFFPVLVFSILLLFSSPGVFAGAEEIPPAAKEKAKSTADALMKDLIGLLFSTLDAEGPAGAARMCSEVAQEKTAQHAREGVYVRRVSLKVRNPVNRPDVVESEILAQMEVLHKQKKLPPETVQVQTNPDGTRQVHYMRPIVVMERCLACHGPREKMQPEVRDLLSHRYPNDRAVEYQAGDFRGAVSVRVTIEK